MKITIIDIRQRSSALFYIYKKRKQSPNVLVLRNKDNVHYIFISKKQDTLCYAIFHENLELRIYIQKASQFALRDLLNRKTSTIRKKQDILRYVFIYKNPDTLGYTMFH